MLSSQAPTLPHQLLFYLSAVFSFVLEDLLFVFSVVRPLGRVGEWRKLGAPQAREDGPVVDIVTS